VRELCGWTKVRRDVVLKFVRNGTLDSFRRKNGSIRIPIVEAERFEEFSRLPQV